jgi:hypothetical protein
VERDPREGRGMRENIARGKTGSVRRHRRRSGMRSVPPRRRIRFPLGEVWAVTPSRDENTSRLPSIPRVI